MNKLLPRRRLLALSALAVLTAGLGACASLNTLRVEVRSFGHWPAGRAPGSFAFDRLPSQQAQASVQERLEAAARPALQMAGFKPASSSASADVLVQLSVQAVQVRGEAMPYPFVRYDGYWGMRRGGFGTGVGFDYHPAYYEQRAAVLIRDRRSGEVVYESQGTLGGTWVDEGHWAGLFEAVLKDFPGPAISPRVVVVPAGGSATPIDTPASAASGAGGR